MSVQLNTEGFPGRHWRARLVCMLCLLLFTAACSAPVAQRLAEPDGIPSGPFAADEQLAGKWAHRWAVQLLGGLYADPQLAAYVDRIGQSLVAGKGAAGEYRFAVLNDLVADSISLQGGFVGITRGLLLQLQSEAQLAAVLGFEIGHISAGHHQQAEVPTGVVLELPADSDYLHLVAGLAWSGREWSRQAYTLKQEQEADQLAVDMLAAAGYLPDAVTDLLEGYLRQQERADGNSSRLHRSHPVNRDRLKKVQGYIGKYYPVRVTRGGSDEFGARLEPLRQSEESYHLYNQGYQLEHEGRFAQAIATYHQALQAAPDDASILAGLGLAYLRTEDTVPARRYLLKAVNLQGDYAKTRLGLGYLYLQKWQYAQAVSQLEQSMRLLPTVECAFLLGEAQQNIGQQRKARDLFQIVAGFDPDGKLGRLAEQRLSAMGE